MRQVCIFQAFCYTCPLPAFSDAAEGGATRLFGENGEPVSAPKQDTGFFDAIVQKKSTNAVFVGHDHLNHLAVRYRGVDLVYPRSIDYIAYPKVAQQRGHRWDAHHRSAGRKLCAF